MPLNAQINQKSEQKPLDLKIARAFKPKPSLKALIPLTLMNAIQIRISLQDNQISVFRTRNDFRTFDVEWYLVFGNLRAY